MKKFKNKYRIESLRLKNWDYGSNAAYFITICTKNRAHFFGEIANRKMILTDIGEFAEKFWLEIPDHFPFIELGNFVVMPDHTHGILIINKNYNQLIDGGTIDGGTIDGGVETPKLGVSIDANATPVKKNGGKNGGKNEKWKPNTIGSIINQYKRIVTINARKINTDFAWQPRYYDHIIRDSASFERIQTYIADNPSKWIENN